MVNDMTVIPTVGDRVIFELDLSDSRGPRAKWWAFEDEYDQALEDIKARTVIRFLWRIGRKKLSRLQEAPEIRKLWEGKDIRELRRLYPVKSYSVMDNGTMARYFEIFLNGQWTKMETDPRMVK